MTKRPLVSVVMATYNEPTQYITQAVQSILNQTLADFELLLIDDSTNVDTVAAIDALAKSDTRIKLFRDSKRIGFVPALNLGLRQAQGAYIARMDGDDISLPGRFAAQVKYLDEHPHVAVVGGAMDIINGAGEITGHRDYADSPLRMKLFSLIRSPLAHPAVMLRRSVVEQGFYYDEAFQKAEDLELWLRLVKCNYSISNLSETLLLYRVIGNLASKRAGGHFNYNYLARKKHFSWRYPVWSAMSLFISRAYTLLPKIFIKIMYKIENNNE
jgi:glycosyltransferase involved in cell wall biosynthesis